MIADIDVRTDNCVEECTISNAHNCEYNELYGKLFYEIVA